ncbi:MAG: formyltetrahydrofolate deformylase [Ignavibacteriae bacterium HGW-Ignavibacteriae-2]|nr:MAG: formyltetrahydrofolate deformylase [Ignavibacteriae bacterium HGW-Ignavibacteriae-2]
MLNKNISAKLLIHCPDQSGIVASVAEFVHKFKGNIIHLNEHVDIEEKTFFMRVEWELENFTISREEIGPIFLNEVGDKFKMNWNIYFSDDVPRAAIFVSKLNHCVFDILSNTFSQNWKLEIPLMISNHNDLRELAEKFGIDFYYLPITSENKTEQELKQLELLEKYKIDFAVLARYMQIVSPDFISKYQNRIINIHHSFLPAFPGAKPYHSAHQRGVKIIGATSHYVTDDLDAGPIISQDVVNVTHKDSVKDLIRKGRDLEKLVLSRAIYLHINKKLLVYNNRTIVFE